MNEQDMSREFIERLGQAEDLLLSIYWDMENNTNTKYRKRLDTILSKVRILIENMSNGN
jgi:hypothetical protein